MAKLRKCPGCIFCHGNDSDELRAAQLIKHDKFNIHYLCLMFSKKLQEQDKDDSVGIFGFKISNIVNEYRRSKRIICSFCGQNGANIHCDDDKCTLKFHMPCGRSNQVFYQYFGEFKSYCKDHVPDLRPPIDRVPSNRVGRFFGTGRIKCTICTYFVPSRSSREVVYSSCCKTAYFHYECVQRQALSSGTYHFRCPNCNDHEKFLENMQIAGIFLPIRDASWEMEDDRYAAMHERPNECSAKVCHCNLEGQREYNEILDLKHKFRLVCCNWCGSKACHDFCSRDEMVLEVANSWICMECRDISFRADAQAFGAVAPLCGDDEDEQAIGSDAQSDVDSDAQVFTSDNQLLPFDENQPGTSGTCRMYEAKRFIKRQSKRSTKKLVGKIASSDSDSIGCGPLSSDDEEIQFTSDAQVPSRSMWDFVNVRKKSKMFDSFVDQTDVLGTKDMNIPADWGTPVLEKVWSVKDERPAMYINVREVSAVQSETVLPAQQTEVPAYQTLAPCTLKAPPHVKNQIFWNGADFTFIGDTSDDEIDEMNQQRVSVGPTRNSDSTEATVGRDSDEDSELQVVYCSIEGNK